MIFSSLANPLTEIITPPSRTALTNLHNDAATSTLMHRCVSGSVLRTSEQCFAVILECFPKNCQTAFKIACVEKNLAKYLWGFRGFCLKVMSLQNWLIQCVYNIYNSSWPVKINKFLHLIWSLHQQKHNTYRLNHHHPKTDCL